MSGPNAADHPRPAEAKQRHQANGQCLAAGRPSTGENQDGHVKLPPIRRDRNHGSAIAGYQAFCHAAGTR
jgi:hypothetical protein